MPVNVRRKPSKGTWAYPGLMSFEEFLDAFGPKDWFELIDGSPVERKMVELEHEKLEVWLSVVLHQFIREKDLGILLVSRFPVKINDYRGRLPDIFFVRKYHMQVVRQKATY